MTFESEPEFRYIANRANRDNTRQVLARLGEAFPDLRPSFPIDPERIDALAVALERATDHFDLRTAAREAKKPDRLALEGVLRTATELRTQLQKTPIRKRLAGYTQLNSLAASLAELASGAERELSAIKNDALKEPGAPDLGSPIETFAIEMLHIAEQHLGITQYKHDSEAFAAFVRAVEDVFQSEPAGRAKSTRTASSLGEALKGRGSK